MLSIATPARRNRATVLLWLMACVLVFAQWMGYQHKLVHLSSQNGEILVLASDQTGQVSLKKITNANGAMHECSLFDAALNGDGLSYLLVLDLVQFTKGTKLVSPLPEFKYRLVLHAFRARAPPV
ncbi:MAG: hypothetical protein K2P84_10765 [Undibacterium sp.]|nr:hypothetical protein [Undibacterium sp.]